MEQPQSLPARQISAQNPPSSPPSSKTSNGTSKHDQSSATSLNSSTAAEEAIKVSPWTNLSRHAITNEMVFGPIPDREYHEGFMRKAIEMAQLALDSDETPVGCVFVRDGEVIGRGINGTNASLNVSFATFITFGDFGILIWGF
jgi:deoxycytidylate deaminase